jgi:hypothetical protein
MTEEHMLEVVLGFAVLVAAGAAWVGGLGAAAVLSASVAVVATCGKLAFDSLVQRDAPDANRGRSFARFEVRFQLVWVIGAVIPLLLLPIPQRVGFAVVSLTALFALVSYLIAQRTGRPPRPPAQLRRLRRSKARAADKEQEVDQTVVDDPDATIIDATVIDPTVLDATRATAAPGPTVVEPAPGLPTEVAPSPAPRLYDGAEEGDFEAAPAPEPEPEPPSRAADDVGDTAGWQVEEPRWGRDPGSG